MDVGEIISLIENCMDVEEGTLGLEDSPSDYEEWDSLTALSVIAAVDEQFHKSLTGKDLKGAKTISDVVRLIR